MLLVEVMAVEMTGGAESWNLITTIPRLPGRHDQLSTFTSEVIFFFRQLRAHELRNASSENPNPMA
jgi:hypothetical protein